MKRKTVIIVILALLILIVNAVTLGIFLKKHSDLQKEASESDEASENILDDNASYFGTPSQIVVFGKGNEKTLLPSDDDFSVILDYCEKSMKDAPPLVGSDSYDYKKLKAYGVKLIYNDKFSLTPKGSSTFEVSEVVVILTGDHYSTISFDVNGYPFVMGELAVQPEFNKLIVEKLKN